ncbi:MAG: 4-hydroxythreonine-4-phosphate dehydrogenase [uncultured Sphingomonas sp.]|uniref:4-hydroxythreonine-4-phosphate dehydrogenase n=1 Tax=uncultured Sphingomonas sp. TaxID=158754 RepID=A0A6J4TAA7_9SPHN|nr:4-hydroxythreonine-4-phosphate dehydrogenase PdxA [uncultured Sphingomonas sp.]CAA9517182.1 MAG: 4-hydroxythreonine-4-phosphate dehydrogenase [uncultured Sphingomonas sp.]
MRSPDLPPIAISLGDPAGIGPEVVAKCWDGRHLLGLPPFVAVGDPRSLSAVWDGEIAQVDDPREADAAFDYGLPLIAVPAAEAGVPGCPTMAGAHCSLDSLELAVGLARAGSVSAVCTGPVSKQQLYAIGFSHPGQTEFVAERCGVSPGNVAMMLAGPTLRTVPVTTHLPLAEVSARLTAALVEAKGRAALRGLQRNFGVAEPRLAVAGLNPHAGEGGALGREEIEIIAPAVAALQAEGWRVTGPHPADTLFHGPARARYDAALCMYHDQALIPLKALHFEEGVNITLGLPIVRTSPDHGTAFDIAGEDRADPRAMAAAIRMAAACAAHRASAATA